MWFTNAQEEMDMRDKQGDEGAYDYQEDFSTAGETLQLGCSCCPFASLCMLQVFIFIQAMLWFDRTAGTGIR